MSNYGHALVRPCFSLVTLVLNRLLSAIQGDLVAYITLHDLGLGYLKDCLSPIVSTCPKKSTEGPIYYRMSSISGVPNLWVVACWPLGCMSGWAVCVPVSARPPPHASVVVSIACTLAALFALHACSRPRSHVCIRVKSHLPLPPPGLPTHKGWGTLIYMIRKHVFPIVVPDFWNTIYLRLD